MNLKRFGAPAVIAMTAALALSSCAANEGGATENGDAGSESTLSGNLVGAGSSAMDAAQQAWIAEFQNANPDVTIEDLLSHFDDVMSERDTVVVRDGVHASAFNAEVLGFVATEPVSVVAGASATNSPQGSPR